MNYSVLQDFYAIEDVCMLLFKWVTSKMYSAGGPETHEQDWETQV